MISLISSYNDLKSSILHLYDDREAAAIAHELLLELTGFGKMDLLINKDQILSGDQFNTFQNWKTQLIAGKPLQYVLAKAWFAGESYFVNQSVLIPRPETEELVNWLVTDAKFLDSHQFKIVDIGTGSGCIPITIKKKLPHATILSCDVSADALHVAKLNAENLKADIQLIQLDFLNQDNWSLIGNCDLIISNPPYIPDTESQKLDINVRNYEPHLALFVPHSNPLIFYEMIALYGRLYLIDGGAIYCEIEQSFGNQALDLFKRYGYMLVQLKKDINGNDRMIKAIK